MSWFDGFGLLFVAALLVPNILFAATRPDGFENRYHNPTVERLEQVVRFGCFILMVLRIPVLCHGYWFDGGETRPAGSQRGAGDAVLVGVAGVLEGRFGAQVPGAGHLALAALFGTGDFDSKYPLLVLAVLFAPCHIAISYGNAKALEKERRA